MNDPLTELERSADTFRFEVPASHRGLPGRGVTAAKRIFVRGLRPMHLETLRPQREFNFAVVRALTQLTRSAVSAHSGAADLIRTALQPSSDPGRWSVRSHRPSLVGNAVSLSKSTWLGVVGPVLKAPLDAQREFNRLAIECVVDLALGRLRPGEAGLRALEAQVDPLKAQATDSVLRATRPLWNEVFRAQVAFNRELVRALAWLSSSQPGENLFFPTLSVVVARPRAESISALLLSIATQGFPAAYETLVVDASSGAALDLELQPARRKFDWLRGTYRRLSEATAAARGDIVVVVDGERVLAPGFLEAHVRAYLANERTDAVTCPLPATASGSPAEPLIDPLTPGSFVNFGTGAYSVRRPVAPSLGDELDAIEAGLRLFHTGARVVFAPEANSATSSTPPADPVEALVARRPELGWVTEAARPARRTVRSSSRRLRILTYRWHCAHQYELFKLPHDFTLMMGAPSMSREWDFKSRPLRPNARFVDRAALNLNDFDLAILPFDESCVNPALANGVLASDWGDLFCELRQSLRIPTIALCHGSVPFHGAFDHRHERPDLVVATNEPERKRIVDFVGDIPVVCNSHQAQAEWQFRDSRVIWHGFDPAEYPLTTARGGALTACPGIARRPHYCGYYLFKAATEGVECAVLGDGVQGAIKVPAPPVAVGSGNDYGYHRFRNYVDVLREYSVFFNPTLLSPMPRSRAEAMLCGLAMVTTPNHDADRFIRDGVNGFVSGDAGEIRERMKYLLANPEAARKLGAAGRETAIREFHIDRYLGQWRELISKVVG
ncbi:MAG: glycosyltransferase [Archangiaceae bacterium]|nr:glycosyltransferase [Archangiaceae bacterium]